MVDIVQVNGQPVIDYAARDYESLLQAMRDQGCNEVQGFLFSPPMPSTAVQALLDATGGRGFSADAKPARTGNVTQLRANV